MMGSLINRLFYFKPKFPQEVQRYKKKYLYKKLYIYDKAKDNVEI